MKPLRPQPEDLLLAPHPAVVRRVAAGPLADREAVLDDPVEVAGDDAGRPAPSHAALRHARAAAVARRAGPPRRSPATSWTRTIAAPRASPRPPWRASPRSAPTGPECRRARRPRRGGRGSSCGSSRPARAAASRRAAGSARAAARGCARRVLPKPMPGIDVDLLDAGGRARSARSARNAGHLARRRRRSAGSICMSAGVPRMCIATKPAPACGGDRAEAGRDVVDERRARPRWRPPRRRGLRRVDRDPHLAGERRARPARHARSSSRRVDRRGPGAGRLAPDVDDVCALADHLMPAGYRGLGVQVAATIEERVGGDIQHSHHSGPHLTA